MRFAMPTGIVLLRFAVHACHSRYIVFSCTIPRPTVLCAARCPCAHGVAWSCGTLSRRARCRCGMQMRFDVICLFYYYSVNVSFVLSADPVVRDASVARCGARSAAGPHAGVSELRHAGVWCGVRAARAVACTGCRAVMCLMLNLTRCVTLINS